MISEIKNKSPNISFGLNRERLTVPAPVDDFDTTLTVWQSGLVTDNQSVDLTISAGSCTITKISNYEFELSSLQQGEDLELYVVKTEHDKTDNVGNTILLTVQEA